MGNRGRSASPAFGPPGAGAFSGTEVRLQLERILASPAFRASRRCQELLRYLVETTLNGHPGEIKERTIGMEVFGRSSSYDPSVDSTVRVKTGDVRRRLSQYYSQADGEDRILIELPPGSYVPQFRVVESLSPAATRRNRAFWSAAAAIILAAVVATAFLLRGPGRSEPALSQFWGPTLGQSAPVLLALSYVPVYGIKPSVEAAGALPSGPHDFILEKDRFIGASDSRAAAKVEDTLARLGGRYAVRIGEDVGFQDLRTSPSVLIGYSYTRWRELSGDMRFAIRSSGWPKGITDNGKPTPWTLAEERRNEEDYALIARVFHPETGKLLVLLAGIESPGTEAAAELAGNDRLLAEALRDAPKDWARRNLQLVLHVKVISGEAGAPRVVARHFW